MGWGVENSLSSFIGKMEAQQGKVTFPSSHSWVGGRVGSESETCGCRAHDLGPEAVLSLSKVRSIEL